eukprot:scaffold97093_cov26-Tisochrysis_lutea.AAC.1
MLLLGMRTVPCGDVAVGNALHREVRTYVHCTAAEESAEAILCIVKGLRQTLSHVVWSRAR